MIGFLKKYFAALYIPILWTLTIAVLCCLPGKMIPDEAGFKIPNFDKLVHMTLFGGFVLLWGLYLTKHISSQRTLLIAFFIFYVLSSFYGYSMELVQRCCIVGRDYDLADIIADLIGAGIGYGLCNLLLLPPSKEEND
jgi:VanZ family protein